MRVIFEEVDAELFFEVILTAKDVEHFQRFNGIVGYFVWDIGGIREINIFIRKEKDYETCHLSKEKKQKQEKTDTRSQVLNNADVVRIKVGK